MVGLLNEMIAKFEEDPPLSAKTAGDDKDPHELLAFVSNFKNNEGAVLIWVFAVHGEELNDKTKQKLLLLTAYSSSFQVEAELKVRRATKCLLLVEEIWVWQQ